MYGGALERMSRDARTAMEMLDCRADCAAGYGRAVNLVREAARRERRALESVSAIIRKGEQGDRALAQVLQQLPTDANAEQRLAAFYMAATGRTPPALTMTSRERELAGRIPALDVTVQQYLDRRGKVDRPRTLHSLMAYEAMNFVDGARSVLDIFRAVSAEADAAGDWYYGTVALEDIAAYLESAEKAGLLKIQAAGTKTESAR
jgi:hypothetical protein